MIEVTVVTMVVMVMMVTAPDMLGDSEQTKQLRKRWREQLANGDPYKCVSFEGFIQMLAAQSSFDDKSKVRP
jgi:hypothetical protein